MLILVSFWQFFGHRSGNVASVHPQWTRYFWVFTSATFRGYRSGNETATDRHRHTTMV